MASPPHFPSADLAAPARIKGAKHPYRSCCEMTVPTVNYRVVRSIGRDRRCRHHTNDYWAEHPIRTRRAECQYSKLIGEEAASHGAPGMQSEPCRECEAKQPSPSSMDWRGIIELCKIADNATQWCVSMQQP
ncbi:hypothetical protein FJTKL_08372 [Diaporthe vaccinii]|uniref:Uncharacterized protein n=1 Tax=Diaporthe vaccinii TaxID=105482 RepID=A0ABR4ERS4_9PEZI